MTVIHAVRLGRSGDPPSSTYPYREETMSKIIATLVAAVFAVASVTPVAFAQDQKKDQKKAQVHKGTPEQGTMQKKEQAGKKKAEAKKAEEKK
jgi:hypothetical protein